MSSQDWHTSWPGSLSSPGPFALSAVYTIGQKAVRGIGRQLGRHMERGKGSSACGRYPAIVVVAGYGIVAANLWFYNTPGISPYRQHLPPWPPCCS